MLSTTTQPQRVARLRELIERAGYDTCFMTGYGVSAVHGVPDTQLFSYGEMARSAQIVCSSLKNIPCLGDGDTGYGNAMNVKRTVAGDVATRLAGKTVVDREEAFARIRAAVEARREGNFDIVIMARTDARGTHSLEEAIARCQEFVRLDADITFLEAPRSVEEMKAFCEQIPGPKLANMVEMGMTPVLLPEELHQIGYKIALYPVTLLNASIKVMEKALVELRNQTTGPTTTTSGVNANPSAGLNELLSDFEHVKDVVGFTDYYKEEELYGTST
ncbi:hypothetical protein V7S43_013752 [Phytophthora oleae]|uniref:Carboxyvinyl-carboxyphosphonate phosphorylmutase n=1 Tax=Phytophthora oleae TaxID=2107226 RepID=A0ABD3F2W8_9STRA